MAVALCKVLKEFGDAFVRIAETFLQTQNFLAHYGEAEVSRFDGARMDRADSDLMHTIAFY